MASEQSPQDMRHVRGRQHQTLGSPQPRHRSKSTRLSHRRRPEMAITCKDDHLVKVFSRSADSWLLGKITRLVDDDFVRVEYRVGKDWYCKTLYVHSANLLTLSLQRLDLEMLRTFVSRGSAQRLQYQKQASSGGVSGQHIERISEEHDPGMLWSAAELNKRGALARYFLCEYLNGEDPPDEGLRHAGYRVRYIGELSTHVFCHEPTGIQVWSEALDLSTPGRDSSEIRLGFHYTTPQAFSTVTHIGNEAVEIWASLQNAGDAFFGEGVYASQRDPNEFGSIEAVLYNNYAIKGDPNKLNEKWDFARCCIPILVDHEACIDVRRQTTPEMKFGPGLDRLGKPLDEGRDVVVLRISDHEDRVINARVPDNHLTVLKRRLTRRLETFGMTHPAVATTRNNMAMVYCAQSKLADALREYEEALCIRIAIFGENHPDVASIRNNIGIVYCQQSKFADALEEYDEALRIWMAALGTSHPAVATARKNMATTYFKQSKFADALREYEEALRIDLATFGENHPDVASTRSHMADVYSRQAKFADALREYEEALRIHVATFGKSHPAVASIRNRMAMVYFEQSRLADALREYEEALRISMSLGKNHPAVATTRNDMATVYVKQSKFADALREYEEALRIYLATFGANHPVVAGTRNNMAMVYWKQAKFADALREYEEGLRIHIATVGMTHPDVASIRNNMALVYSEQSRLADALREYEEALRILMATFGENHPAVASIRNNMAAIYSKQSKFADALREYEEALRIRMAILGSDHPDVAATKRNISRTYREQSELADAMLD